ncbi:MAG: hypothetical protein K9G61_05820 [Bacteroidales bacterium]|nr:hypothetical protein [Bacteroidales bacterium]
MHTLLKTWKQSGKITLTLLLFILLYLPAGQVIAQPPPPPPSHGGSSNQNAGNGAPIGGGLFILLGLGAAYGARKAYLSQKETLED